MANPKPINELNAIDAVAFAIIFDTHFSKAEIKKLRSLKTTLQEELPNFDETTKVEVAISKEDKQFSQEPAGVRLSRISPNSQELISLQVSENQIVTNFRKYDKWDNIWPKAKLFIESTLKCLELKERCIVAVVLQYVDKFIEEDKNYNLYDIFDKNSSFINKQISSSYDNLWHLHQGWFENINDTSRKLNVLNIGTNREEQNTITIIDHACHIQFSKENKVPVIELNDGTNNIEALFDDLHKNNKGVISKLLNSKQLEVIGINE